MRHFSFCLLRDRNLQGDDILAFLLLQYEAPQSFWPEEPSYQEPEPSGPLAGPNVMNVVLVGAECAPWSKTGSSCHSEPSSSLAWVF